MHKFSVPILASTLIMAGTLAANAGGGCGWSHKQAKAEEPEVVAAIEPVVEEKVEVAVSTYAAGKGHICERKTAYRATEVNMSEAVIEAPEGSATDETRSVQAATAEIGFSSAVIAVE